MTVRFPDEPGFQGRFAPVRLEGEIRGVEVTQGEIPASLRGTYYRVGADPAWPPFVERDFYFNADGMVAMFRFENGYCDFRSRYVRTPRFDGGAGGAAVAVRRVPQPVHRRPVRGRPQPRARQHERVLARRTAARLQGGQRAGPDRPGHPRHGRGVHLGGRPVVADGDRASQDRPARPASSCSSATWPRARRRGTSPTTRRTRPGGSCTRPGSRRRTPRWCTTGRSQRTSWSSRSSRSPPASSGSKAGGPLYVWDGSEDVYLGVVPRSGSTVRWYRGHQPVRLAHHERLRRRPAHPHRHARRREVRVPVVPRHHGRAVRPGEGERAALPVDDRHRRAAGPGRRDDGVRAAAAHRLLRRVPAHRRPLGDARATGSASST